MTAIPVRTLGPHSLRVSALGLGCMGMSFAYGPADEERSIATLHHALDRGINLLDTADVYGPETNERLLAGVLRERREEVVLATKCGIAYADPDRAVDGRPAYIHRACDASLSRLATDRIDLFYLHRVDPEVPIEETVGAMTELIAAGKVRHIGLSEAAAATIRRAHAVHPLTAVQMEYSLWTRGIETDILPLARELGIGIVPYSPLGRGFLSGQITSPDDLGENDWRRDNPRFQGENFERNLELVNQVTALAHERNATPAQIALAWVLQQGNDIVPIPGTTRAERLDENIAALDVELGSEDLQRLDAIFGPEAVAGERYTEAMMRLVRN
ncbi:aldo/keto reductase [Halofilum ochraceum]|uniref:aldo/keto reductase n=1 Tax=Halofilum ochraceum TaxID=1611323 RepID=UPI0008D9AACB|nr:aldo/keto reductase [Halofilum ochraceum]